jgi:prolyl-tRNA editing enzyme YbaK/EbsC (Cys-tRNA(Pro) deacylase)
MNEHLSSTAQKVQDFLNSIGFSGQVVELPDSTRTAPEAAQAIGCTVEQIVKSLVFRGRKSGKAVMVVASGGNRVDEKKLAAYFGEPVERAAPEFVREQTGFAIGGVPPAGHLNQLKTFIDKDLLQYGEIWAAAGTGNAVFCLTPADLQRITDGEVVDIRK